METTIMVYIRTTIQFHYDIEEDLGTTKRIRASVPYQHEQSLGASLFRLFSIFPSESLQDFHRVKIRQKL